jgi:ADP-ribosyl-[dinitrogen reductase] hydrolase
MMENSKNLRKQKVKNALWGLFIGDALAMPAHWYYNTNNIPKYLDGPVDDYKTPPDNHVEAFMVGAGYKPDVEAAKKAGRKFDILHDHARFYKTTYTSFEESGFGIDEKGVIKMKDRFHYHYGLKAGENTLNAHLVRLLMRRIVKDGNYNPDYFLADFIEYMTTSGNNRDPYTEGYLRAWFENYSKGLPTNSCAASQREIPGINALGGLIRPMVVSLLAGDQYNALGFAAAHQQLTHRSENITSSLTFLVPTLHEMINGSDAMEVLKTYSGKMHLPKYEGSELFAKYMEYGGIAKVPREVMWQLHTELKDEPWNLEKFANENSEAKVLKKIFSTACYPEHGVPMLAYLAWKYNFDFEKALLANVNAGGDNVHRSMALGMLLGAAAGSIPEKWINGLTAKEELEKEIDAFAEIATR